VKTPINGRARKAVNPVVSPTKGCDDRHAAHTVICLKVGPTPNQSLQCRFTFSPGWISSRDQTLHPGIGDAAHSGRLMQP
jgi:hypothetical protein